RSFFVPSGFLNSSRTLALTASSPVMSLSLSALARKSSSAADAVAVSTSTAARARAAPRMVAMIWISDRDTHPRPLPVQGDAFRHCRHVSQDCRFTLQEVGRRGGVVNVIVA